MGRVLTNNTGMNYAIEESLGVLPANPAWKALEPNGISNFGADITTVAREPISQNRQRRKGTITDLDSAVEFEADVTLDSFIDFVEAFLFALATNQDTFFRAAAATSAAYTVPALNAAQVAKLQFNASGPTTLVNARGYNTLGNNGLKPLTAQPSVSGTALTVAGLVAETAPANAVVELAGIRASAGDLALTAASGQTATLSSGNGGGTAIDFTTLGLTVGQSIHIGGVAAANQPFITAAVTGYARIRSISAGALVLDKISADLNAGFDGTDDNSGGTALQIDLLFGRFIRNVPVSSSEFLERSIQFEAAFPNLFETTPPTSVANPNGYEYALGQLANQLAWSLPLTDKSTATFGFVGTDAEPPVNDASRKTNAANARQPLDTTAFNTSADFARLRILNTDESGLTTDFKDMTFTMNNNVSPEKVLGNLGARFMNYGNFEVDIETSVLFTSADVIDRIRRNVTVTMDWIVRNDDGAIAVDVPSMTLGNGQRSFPVNETVTAQLTGQAFIDPTFGTSIGVSLFPVFVTASR